MPTKVTRKTSGVGRIARSGSGANDQWSNQDFDESCKVIEAYYSQPGDIPKKGLSTTKGSPTTKQQQKSSSTSPSRPPISPPQQAPPLKRSPKRRNSRDRSPQKVPTLLSKNVKAVDPRGSGRVSPSGVEIDLDDDASPRKPVIADDPTRFHLLDRNQRMADITKRSRLQAMQEDDRAKGATILKTIMENKEKTKYESALDHDHAMKPSFYHDSPMRERLATPPGRSPRSKRVAVGKSLPPKRTDSTSPQRLPPLEANSTSPSQSPRSGDVGFHPKASHPPRHHQGDAMNTSTTSTTSARLGGSGHHDDQHIPVTGYGYRSAAADMRSTSPSASSPKGAAHHHHQHPHHHHHHHKHGAESTSSSPSKKVSSPFSGGSLPHARAACTQVQRMLRFRLSWRIADALKPRINITEKALPTLQSHLRTLRSGASKAQLTAVLAVQPFVKTRLALDDRQRRFDVAQFRAFQVLKQFARLKASALHVRALMYRPPLPMKTISIAVRSLLFILKLRRRLAERMSGVVATCPHRCTPYTELLSIKSCTKPNRKRLLDFVCGECRIVYSPATRRLMAELAVDEKFLGPLRLLQSRSRLRRVLLAAKANTLPPRPTCFSEIGCCERCTLILSMFEGKPLALLTRAKTLKCRSPRSPKYRGSGNKGVPFIASFDEAAVDQMVSSAHMWSSVVCANCYHKFTQMYIPLWEATLRKQIAIGDTAIKDVLYLRPKKDRPALSASLLVAWYRFRKHLKRSITSSAPSEGGGQAEETSSAVGQSQQQQQKRGLSLGRALCYYAARRCIALGCVSDDDAALGSFYDPAKWDLPQWTMYLLCVRDLADAAALLPLLMKQFRAKQLVQFVSLRWMWRSRDAMYPLIASVAFNGGASNAGTGAPTLKKRALRPAAVAIDASSGSTSPAASPTMEEARRPTLAPPAEEKTGQDSPTGQQEPAETSPCADGVKGEAADEADAATPKEKEEEEKEEGAAKTEDEAVNKGKEVDDDDDEEEIPTADANASLDAVSPADAAQPLEEEEETAQEADDVEVLPPDATAAATSEEAASPTEAEEETPTPADASLVTDALPEEVESLGEGEADEEEGAQLLRSGGGGLSSSLASGIDGTSIIWATGHVTTFCSERCFMFGELLSQQQVQNVDLKGRHIVSYLENMCTSCKEAIIHDLLAVRKVLRSICVVQCRTRWRLMRRRRLLELTQANGGVSPVLIAKQAAVSKGRCARCEPFLEVLRKRMRYFRRQARRRADVFAGQGSPTDSYLTVATPKASLQRTKSETSRTSASSSVGYDVETADMSSNASFRTNETSLRGEPTLHSTRSTSSIHPKKVGMTTKERKQFIRDTSSLIFEMCERCQCIAKAEIKHLK